MGLAASQARLLLLTARKSDLEYRAQSITNTEMVLAMQTEAVARKYSEAISNTCLFFTHADNAAGTIQEALNMGNLASVTAAGYRIEVITGKDANGDPIYSDYAPEKGNSYRTWTPSADITIGSTQYKAGTPVDISNDIFVQLSEDERKNCSEEKYNEYNNVGNELTLLEGLNNGTYRIVDAKGDPVSLSGNNKFTESYYTDDDAQAEAEYKRETASIQVKEKRLQMELNQVEAQQKACDTEIDSVKKVMDKNIERTFKVFSYLGD